MCVYETWGSLPNFSFLPKRVCAVGACGLAP